MMGGSSNGHGPGVLPPQGGPTEPPLGELVILLLASTLAGLRDRLASDGFEVQADLVADLVEIADDYLTRQLGA